MYLITGGAGFIGSNIAAAIEARGLGKVVICDRLGNEDKWKKFNNSFLYQNRLRHQDYVRIFYEFNLNIIELKKGKKIKPPVIISQDFDKNNTDTFVSSGYFLGKILP